MTFNLISWNVHVDVVDRPTGAGALTLLGIERDAVGEEPLDNLDPAVIAFCGNQRGPPGAGEPVLPSVEDNVLP
jgi:hypothetical protein